MKVRWPVGQHVVHHVRFGGIGVHFRTRRSQRDGGVGSVVVHAVDVAMGDHRRDGLIIQTNGQVGGALVIVQTPVLIDVQLAVAVKIFKGKAVHLKDGPRRCRANSPAWGRFPG